MADFLQAVQTGSSLFDQAQRRRMAQEQMDMEKAQLPLQQILQTQQSQMNQFKIEEILSTRQAEIDTKATLQEIGGLVGQKLASDDPMGAQQLLLQSLAKNPTMGDTTTFQQLQKYVGTSLMAKQQLKEMQGFMPTIEKIENPVTGKMEAVLRRGPNDSTLIQPPDTEKPTTQIQNSRELARLQEAIEVSEDPAERKSLQRRYDALQLEVAPPGTTVFGLDGKPMVQIGGRIQQGSGVAQGLQSEIITKITAQKRLVEGLQGLVQSDAARFFNPADKLANKFVDQLYASFNPGAANPERISAFQKNQELRNASIRALTDDKGQLSEGDARRIGKLFPTDDVFTGTPAEAKVLWQGLISSAKSNARRLGESIGNPEIWAYETDELASLPRLFPDKVTSNMIIDEWKRRGIVITPK